MTASLDARVDRLLHDAERKDAGARLARQMRDFDGAEHLEKERDQLVAKALEIDPDRTADAWSETTLKTSPKGA